MGSETELKFEVSPKDLERLKSARSLHRPNTEPFKEEDLVLVYFDTGKHRLRRKGISLRVRHSGDQRFQTVKTDGQAGPFSRGEWEHKIKGDEPDLHAARGSALTPLLTKKLKHALKPIFETRVHRTTVQLHKNGRRIEVALDQGQFRAGQKGARGPACARLCGRRCIRSRTGRS